MTALTSIRYRRPRQSTAGYSHQSADPDKTGTRRGGAPLLALVVPAMLTRVVGLGVAVSKTEWVILCLTIALGSALTFRADPLRRVGPPIALWSVMGLGTMMSLRLNGERTSGSEAILSKTFGVGDDIVRLSLTLLGSVGLLLLATTLVRRLRHRGAVIPIPALFLSVVALFLARFLLPKVTGNIFSGRVMVPGLGSIQVGEFVSPLAVVLWAVLLVQVFNRKVILARTRDQALAVGTVLLLIFLVLALALFDAGPAVVMLVGYSAVWFSVTRGMGPLKRFGLPLLSVCALLGVARVLLLVPVVQRYFSAKTTVIAERFRGGAARDTFQIQAANSAVSEGGAIGRGLDTSSLADKIPVGESDLIFASISADFGAIPAGLLACVMILSLAQLGQTLANGDDAFGAASRGLISTQTAVLTWSLLGAWSLVPLTGISAPYLVATGSALGGTLLTLGVLLASTDTTVFSSESLPPSPRMLPQLVVIIIATLVVALRPWSLGSLPSMAAPRGEILASDGLVLVSTGPDGERLYPEGASYAEVTGRTWGLEGHSGLEESFAETLACGGATPWMSKAEGLLHPVPCVPAAIVTTVVPSLQKLAADSLSGIEGAAVVIDATDGDILALYSTDAGDPSDWAPQDKNRLRLLATNSPVAPGSVVKPLIAAIAIEDGGSIGGAPHDVYQVDGQSIENLNGKWCANTTIAGALAESCNTTFAKLAVDLGSRLQGGLVSYFDARGTTSVSGVASFGIDSGLDGDNDVEDSSLARTGIGQEGYRATPLGIATATSYLISSANSATAMEPRTVRGVCRGRGAMEEYAPEVANVSPLSKSTAEQVYLAMAGSLAAGGTLASLEAWASALPNEVVGKTGTADVSTDESSSGLAHWAMLIVDRRYVVVAHTRGENDNVASINTARRMAEHLATVDPILLDHCPQE